MESNPHLLEANKVYTVPLHSTGSINVSFTTKVVNEVFRSDDMALALYSQRALPQIRKGVKGGAAVGAGLKRLKSNRDVIELAVTGKEAGSVRLGGYFVDGTLRFVHWVNANDHHTMSYSRNFRDAVFAANPL
ncbi:MAG: hypothetical protein R2827_03730 [Bdellovibrionales bacterium]